MRRWAKGKRVEIDNDSQLRAMHDNDCDLAIFLGGRIADELKNGPRGERLATMLEESDQKQEEVRTDG